MPRTPLSRSHPWLRPPPGGASSRRRGRAGSLLPSSDRTGPASRPASRASSASLKPLAGVIERHGLDAHDIAYLPQTAEIDRTFPIAVYDMVAMGLWRKEGLFGGIGEKAPASDRSGASRRRPRRLRAIAPSARCPAGRCSGCCSPGCWCRTPRDRARRAVHRHRRADLGTTCWIWSGAGMANSARCWRRCTTSIWCARIFRKPCCWRGRRWPGAPTSEALTAENLLKARRMCEAFDDGAEACAVDDHDI